MGEKYSPQKSSSPTCWETAPLLIKIYTLHGLNLDKCMAEARFSYTELQISPCNTLNVLAKSPLRSAISLAIIVNYSGRSQLNVSLGGVVH